MLSVNDAIEPYDHAYLLMRVESDGSGYQPLGLFIDRQSAQLAEDLLRNVCLVGRIEKFCLPVFNMKTVKVEQLA